MKKTIQFEPAFDHRSTNCGIGSMQIRFILTGKEGAVQFLLSTNWNLPDVQKELDKIVPDKKYPYSLYKPLPMDLGYHSLTPRYKGQKILSHSCEVLDGKPCYYDGSGLNAEPVFETLLKDGDDGVWRELQQYYDDVFGNEMDKLLKLKKLIPLNTADIAIVDTAILYLADHDKLENKMKQTLNELWKKWKK